MENVPTCSPDMFPNVPQHTARRSRRPRRAGFWGTSSCTRVQNAGTRVPQQQFVLQLLFFALHHNLGKVDGGALYPSFRPFRPWLVFFFSFPVHHAMRGNILCTRVQNAGTRVPGKRNVGNNMGTNHGVGVHVFLWGRGCMTSFPPHGTAPETATLASSATTKW